MIKVKLSKLFIIFLFLGLGGCSSKTYLQAKKGSSDILKKTDELLPMSQNKEYFKSYTRVKVNNKKSYLPTKVSKEYEKLPLPDFVEAEGVSIVSAKPLGLSELARLITSATGIPVSFDYNELNVSPNTTTSSSEISDAESLSQALNSQYVGVENDVEKMDVNYKGPLSNFLKLVSAKFDIAWKYESGVLIFSRRETKTFSVRTLPVVKDVSSNLEGGSSSDGTGDGKGEGDNSVRQTYRIDVWGELEKNISSIINGDGSYSVSRSLSTVTVNTKPSIMRKVSEYVDSLNKQLSQQVSVKVSVYSIDVSENSDWSASLKSVISAFGGKFEGSIGSEFSNEGSPFISGRIKGGPSVALSMLDKEGKATVVTNATITTMSGQPVPFAVRNKRGYLSSISKVSTERDTSLTASTSTVNAGFSLNILPQIIDGGKVLMQYGIDISSLDGADNGFDKIKIGDNQLQLLNMSQRAFIQESILNNNESLILAGYESVQDKISDSGVGYSRFKLLGGSAAGGHSRSVLIICITPLIMDMDNV